MPDTTAEDETAPEGRHSIGGEQDPSFTGYEYHLPQTFSVSVGTRVYPSYIPVPINRGTAASLSSREAPSTVTPANPGRRYYNAYRAELQNEHDRSRADYEPDYSPLAVDTAQMAYSSEEDSSPVGGPLSHGQWPLRSSSSFGNEVAPSRASARLPTIYSQTTLEAEDFEPSTSSAPAASGAPDPAPDMDTRPMSSKPMPPVETTSAPAQRSTAPSPPAMPSSRPQSASTNTDGPQATGSRGQKRNFWRRLLRRRDRNEQESAAPIITHLGGGWVGGHGEPPSTIPVDQERLVRELLSQGAAYPSRATLSHHRSMPGPSTLQAPHTGTGVLRSARSEADIPREPEPSLPTSQRLLAERTALAFGGLERQLIDFRREMEGILIQLCERFTQRSEQLVVACHREHEAFLKQAGPRT
ncbi:hypothetical protein K470DRAFT_279248 [Piedraia hortae CBS 480.64]|uniref:Uncharacterized protein n=1 Tax=Piedraia hortae CBS 480.64 TaxID=1314780 RepID=A0A6A7BSK0_9PEZI|nr:hypothetical protein K470DRAFT_279248 [Piedraia hortae CBS 480.64]